MKSLPSRDWEDLKQGLSWVAGVDEVGRGCLAGPVVAAALLLPPQIDWDQDSWLVQVKDSKQLKPSQRQSLVPRLTHWAAATGLGIAEVWEVDKLNVLQASLLAMRRATQQLLAQFQVQYPHTTQESIRIWVDGLFAPPGLPQVEFMPLVKGDQRCLSIAGASILAKVWRDDYMETMELSYPGYGWKSHRGYPTRLHRQAIAKQGLTQIHRRTFRISPWVEEKGFKI